MVDTSDSGNAFITRRSLLLRLQSDGPEREVAWEDFYNRYAPIIGGFARKLGAAPGNISDLVQDVMVGFFAASPTFVYDPSRGRFRGYLKVCVLHAMQKLFGDSLRPGGRRLTSIGVEDVAVEHVWNDVWETEKLQHAVERVRQQYQRRKDNTRTFQAFHMHVILQRAAEDVATELNMNVSSVYQAKTRVSRAIRTAMEDSDNLID